MRAIFPKKEIKRRPPTPSKSFRILRWVDLPAGCVRPISILRVRDHPVYFRHRHEFSEIVIVMGGAGLMVVGQERLPIKAGDAFVIHSDQEHAYEETQSLDIVNINFDPAYMAPMQSMVKNWPSYHALFTVEPNLRAKGNFNKFLSLNSKSLSNITDIIQQLQMEVRHRNPGSEMVEFGCFVLLIAKLCRCYDHDSSTGKGSTVSRVAKAIMLIESSYQEPLNINQVAAACHSSRRQFFRLFEQAMGATPMEYLRGVRLRKARELLYSGNRSITDVAFACGFNDSNYFASVFRKEFGQTPSHFRRSFPEE